MKPELTTPDPVPVPALPTWLSLVPKAAAQSAGLTLAAIAFIGLQVVQEGGALWPFVRAVVSPSGLLLAGASVSLLTAMRVYIVRRTAEWTTGDAEARAHLMDRALTQLSGRGWVWRTLGVTLGLSTVVSAALIGALAMTSGLHLSSLPVFAGPMWGVVSAVLTPFVFAGRWEVLRRLRE
jgi:hypothetical protein